MHYFIDGYNLFFRLNQGKKSLREGREKIIASLIEIKLSLTLVFDGAEDDLSHRTHKGPLEIVYTAKGQSADTYILDEISRVKSPKEYTVVTSDRQLSDACRMAGAHSQTISAFLTALKKKQSIKPSDQSFKDTEKDLQRLLKIFNELVAKF